MSSTDQFVDNIVNNFWYFELTGDKKYTPEYRRLSARYNDRYASNSSFFSKKIVELVISNVMDISWTVVDEEFLYFLQHAISNNKEFIQNELLTNKLDERLQNVKLVEKPEYLKLSKEFIHNYYEQLRRTRLLTNVVNTSRRLIGKLSKIRRQNKDRKHAIKSISSALTGDTLTRAKASV